MPQHVPPLSIRVPQGGRLITDASTDQVGPADYTEKTNFRRLDDFEVRREGYLKFRPNTGIPQGTQAFEGADVVGLWEATRPNGDRAVVLLTETTVYRYDYSSGTWSSIGGPFTGSLEWQVESLDGYLIFNNGVDLPFTFRVEDSSVTPIYEMRDVGIASVGTIAIYNGFLMVADITEIQSDELADWMNDSDPYGIPDSSITNRIRYKIGFSDYQEPRNWSPIITGMIESSTKTTVTLEYPVPFAFPVGALLGIDGAGDNGGMLGGQSGIDDGVEVTAVAGNVLTIGTPASSVGTVYPLTVSVSRFADVSTFSGFVEIQDDSSAILRMKQLKRLLVVYRETGIFLGRYTADVENPFIFTPAYGGRNVPAHPRAVIEVDGDYHLYPTKNRFYMFDGTGEPRIHEPMNDARSLFFEDLTVSNPETVFAVTNPITNEHWFACPNGILAYDYLQKTVSWIDHTITAAAYVRKPSSDDFWFIMARDGEVLQYGATEEGAITYLRLGSATTPSLTFGVSSLGDDRNEKDLLNYLPLLASGSSDVDLEIKLYGGDTVAQSLDLLLTYTLTTSASLADIEMLYRNIYFQDKIRVTDTGDVPVTFVGRTFTFNRIQTRGLTRNASGNG